MCDGGGGVIRTKRMLISIRGLGEQRFGKACPGSQEYRFQIATGEQQLK